MKSIALKALKFWQTSELQLVWQIQIRVPESLNLDVPKKCFLVCDLNQNNFGIKISIDKPGGLDAKKSFVAIVRKYAPLATIVKILKNDRGDFFIPILTKGSEGEPKFAISLRNSRPPEAVFIGFEEAVDFIRLSSKGSFTKKKATSEFAQFETSNYQDILKRLVISTEFDLPGGVKDPTETELNKPPTIISQEQRTLLSKLRRKLRTAKKSLAKQQLKIPDKAEVEYLQIAARYLQQYSYMVRSDDFELQLDYAQTGIIGGLTIVLNPDFSIGKNVDFYFSLAKKKMRSLQLGEKHLDRIESHICNLEEEISRYEKESMDSREISTSYQDFKLIPNQNKITAGRNAVSKPYKTYQIDLGLNILVGKSARENDELTKAAKANDYWFHAVGVVGSHVVMPANFFKKLEPSEQEKKKAAILALHFSAARGDQAGEVYFTRKQYLKKKKGMPPGLWSVERSETFFIRYTAEDLREVLDALILK